MPDCPETPPDKMPSWLTAMMGKVDTIQAKVVGLDNTMKGFIEELKEVRRVADFACGEVKAVEERVVQAVVSIKALQQENIGLREGMVTLQNTVTKMEAQSRRDNLVFDGVDEAEAETWADCERKLQELFTEKLGISDMLHIERAHRVGPRPRPGQRPRAIVAKFAGFKAREAVWAKRSKLKGTRVWVSEDYPPEVRQRRKVLYPVYRAALQGRPNTYKRVSLGMDTLSIDGVRYDASNLHTLPEALRPTVLASKSDEQTSVFFTGQSALSNFFKGSPFTIRGNNYACGEQAYQHLKAEFFKDDTAAAKILVTSDPHEQYRLGKSVRGFRADERWLRQARVIMKEVATARFSQDAAVAGALQDTGDRTLGEASRDPFWGVGLPLGHPDVLNRAAWSGQNTMGAILMEVRSGLLV